MPLSQQITDLLLAWGRGEQAALERLIPLVHKELRRLAHSYMRQQNCGHILQTTALINETYLRLLDCQMVNWQDRAHFIAVSAQLMRRVLVDYARSRNSQKRGSGAGERSIEEVRIKPQEMSRELIALDDALEALSVIDLRKSQVVELRFFGGWSVKETAAALNVSPETVQREWRLAKAWLNCAMKPGSSDWMTEHKKQHDYRTLEANRADLSRGSRTARG